MTLEELGKTLGSMYYNAPKKDSVTMIHLFGIKYFKEINECGFSKKEIAKSAKTPVSYGTEISKGVRLANYVKIV